MKPEIDYKQLGQRIEQRRRALGLTLADLAAEVDLSASTIQRYEKGKFEKIKMPVIEALAVALNVNPAWITGHVDDPIDYEEPSLVASIPLSYMEACDGDTKRAYNMMLAAEKDAAEYSSQYVYDPSDDELMAAFFHGADPSLTEEDLEAMWQDAKNFRDFIIAKKMQEKK